MYRGNEVGVLSGGVAVSVNGTSGHGNYQNFIAGAVCHHGRVAEGSLEVVDRCRGLSVAHGHILHLRPCVAVVVAGTAYHVHLSVAGVGAAHQTCRHGDEASVAGCADAGDAVGRDDAVTLAGVVEILALGFLHGLQACHLDGVAIHGDCAGLQHVVQYACRQVLLADFLVRDEETSVEGGLLLAVVGVGNVCIGIVCDVHIIYILALGVYGFESPQEVVGGTCACCPCGDEVSAAHLEVGASVGTVHRLGKVVVAVLAHIAGLLDGQFVECACYGTAPTGTCHHGLAVAVLHAQFAGTLVCDVPDTVVCLHLGVGLKGELHAVARVQGIVEEVFCACRSLADDAVVAGAYAFGQCYLHLKAVQEVLQVVHLGSAIHTCHAAALETLQEDVQYGHLLGVVLILLLQDHHLLVLVYALDEALEAHAGAVAGIVAIGVARTELAETAVRQRMLVPVDP